MIWLLLAIPLVGALLALAFPGRVAAGALAIAPWLHLAVSVSVWIAPPPPVWGGWLAITELSRLFLLVTSAIFAVASIYAGGYLRREAHGVSARWSTEAVFPAGILAFLAAMSLASLSQHLGLTWVAVEGTTLASAPLMLLHRSPRALEATWKYLLICSVGLALALLGTFFLALAAQMGTGHATLDVPALMELAPRLNSPWLRGAFILALVGYGTKMGLAPMHSWLPDAHSEAPSVVSALLSGTLLHTSFLPILQLFALMQGAGEGAVAKDALLVLGLLSMVFGAFFILGQTDYKRMFAYSSVEHMGVLAVGVAVGGVATGGALLHMVNHSAAKVLLFLAAGNVLAAFGTREMSVVRGVRRTLPITGALWVVGVLAITGTPPFGLFWSEWTVLRGLLDAGRYGVSALFLLALGVAFLGLVRAVLEMVQGPAERRAIAEPLWSVAPGVALAGVALMLGLWIPASLREAIGAAAQLLGGEGF